MKFRHSTYRTTFFLCFLALLLGFMMLKMNGYERAAPGASNIRLVGFNPALPSSKEPRRASVRTVVRKPPNQNKSAVQLEAAEGIGAPAESNRRNPSIPSSYLPLTSIDDIVQGLQSRYPDLCHVEKVGTSTTYGLPLWGVRISDNAAVREDEPRILFVGVHHAREPIGASICLALMNLLLKKYGRDDDVTRWVDEMEIWFIPVVNPDGYKYIFDHKDLRFPWWRKNLRDNDGDGVFNPLYDGVDLNRNYDFNWDDGGDPKPGSWFFRGATPFSENETRAIMELAMRENFAIGVSYHSFGESILFPWGNYQRPPDLDLIVDIAGKMASQIRREGGNGTYTILPLNARVGQSSIWMYGYLNVIDYIVEVGTEYFPKDDVVPFILSENIKGASYLLDRMLETGIKGHVRDSETGEPLVAEIDLRRYSADYVRPRRSDADTGSFYRLVNPGEYVVTISAEGYNPATYYNVRARQNQFVNLEVGLSRRVTYTNGRIGH